jgi:hypothetical protein
MILSKTFSFVGIMTSNKNFPTKKKKNETKRTFLKNEIEENGLGFIKECLKNSNFEEISFEGK